jgi:hypothetical protein
LQGKDLEDTTEDGFRIMTGVNIVLHCKTENRGCIHIVGTRVMHHDVQRSNIKLLRYPA